MKDRNNHKPQDQAGQNAPQRQGDPAGEGANRRPGDPVLGQNANQASSNNTSNPDAQGAKTGKSVGRPRPGKDITHVLEGWDHEPGTINVRKIRGDDGTAKIQLRLDLGLLQMELNGRPDGSKPHGRDSLLDYFEDQLAGHRKEYGTDLGFELNGEDCRRLREEAVMYYQRYLSLFVLEEYEGVIRDTARNLRVLDVCRRYASDDDDRVVLEQYRPYIVMMNTRAVAKLLTREEKYGEALHEVDRGLRRIKRFFRKYDRGEAYKASSEVKVLKRLRREIKRKLPVDPIEQLNRRLNKAVELEDYELAAMLRDEIKRREAEVA